MAFHCILESLFKTEAGLICGIWLGEKWETVREEFIYPAVSCPLIWSELTRVYTTKATENVIIAFQAVQMREVNAMCVWSDCAQYCLLWCGQLVCGCSCPEVCCSLSCRVFVGTLSIVSPFPCFVLGRSFPASVHKLLSGRLVPEQVFSPVHKRPTPHSWGIWTEIDQPLFMRYYYLCKPAYMKFSLSVNTSLWNWCLFENKKYRKVFFFLCIFMAQLLTSSVLYENDKTLHFNTIRNSHEN